jgi:hypothetical protein
LTLIIAVALFFVVVVVVAIAVPLAVVFGTGVCVLTPSQGFVYCITQSENDVADGATQFKLIDADSTDCLDADPRVAASTSSSSTTAAATTTTTTTTTTNWTDFITGSRPRAQETLPVTVSLRFRVESIGASICMARSLSQNDYYVINSLTSDECAVAAQRQGTVKATWTRGATPDDSGSVYYVNCGV